MASPSLSWPQFLSSKHFNKSFFLTFFVPLKYVSTILLGTFVLNWKSSGSSTQLRPVTSANSLIKKDNVVPLTYIENKSSWLPSSYRTMKHLNNWCWTSQRFILRKLPKQVVPNILYCSGVSFSLRSETMFVLVYELICGDEIDGCFTNSFISCIQQELQRFHKSFAIHNSFM